MFDKHIKRIRRWGIFGIIIGILFILVGIVSLVLPVLPGIVFIVVGCIILGADIRFLKKWHVRLFGKKRKEEKAKERKKQLFFA